MSIRSWRAGVTTLLATALVAGGGLAAAYAQHPADADLGEASIEFQYVEDLGQLVYWLPGEDLVDDEGTPVDCAAAIDGALNPADPGQTTDEGTPAAEDTDLLNLPDGCIAIDITGPNGQVNHGTFVSAFVHSVKQLEYDGPRGQLVSQMARVRFDSSPAGSTATAATEKIDDDGPGSNATGRDRPKKPKKENPGRGHGRP